MVSAKLRITALSTTLYLCAPLLTAETAERAMSALPGYENRPVIRALRLEDNESITVDGRLDEPAWKRAVPVSDFIQQDPNNGEPATERTEVRILFNRKSLFMGVICYEGEPKKIQRNQMSRDGYLPSDDRFQWTIDPFLNGLNGYFFETNPNGAMGDALIIGGGGDGGGDFGNQSIRGWDGIWYERVRRNDTNWTIEVEIPFQTLAFDAMAPAWGINFQRTIKHTNEESLWNGWGRNQNIRRMTNAGLLEGLSEISQGHGIAIQPYLIGRFTEAPPGANAPWNVVSPNVRGVGGGDVTYSITPTLKARVSLNTDFAETETDQRQVNLTQFSLFFPEKRGFFLEGSNFFSFSREYDNMIMPYFSRTIGLSADGTTQQRIIYGAKVAGQIGAYDLGFLQVETANSGALNGENLTVFRGRRRFFKQSYAGVIFTRRSDHTGIVADRYTAGADFSLATSNFRGNQNFELSGFYLKNENTVVPGGSGAFGIRVDYPNDRWNVNFGFREIQPNWNPALGFVQRVDVRHYSPAVQFAPRPKNNRLVRRYLYHVWLDYFTDTHNVPRTRELDLQAFGVEFQSGDRFFVHFRNFFQSPAADFIISNGIVIPKDSRYNYGRFSVNGQTADRRKVAIGGSYDLGQFYSGTRREVFANLAVRPRPGLALFADYDWNRVELTQGKFTTNLFRFTASTQLSPFVSLTNNIQYDNVSRLLGWQSRFRWIARPGNDVYIVYTHNWLSDPIAGLQTFTRSAATKIVYTHQF